MTRTKEIKSKISYMGRKAVNRVKQNGNRKTLPDDWEKYTLHEENNDDGNFLGGLYDEPYLGTSFDSVEHFRRQHYGNERMPWLYRDYSVSTRDPFDTSHSDLQSSEEPLDETTDPYDLTMQKLLGLHTEKSENIAALIYLSPCSLAAANAARQKRQNLKKCK